MKTIPILLAGGIGERFWPLSRSTMPKQLLPLISDKSMLEDTLERIKPLCRKGDRPLIISSAAIAGAIKKSLPKTIDYDLISEPVGKNTAPAVALAAAYIEQKYGESMMVVLSADHAISPRSEYLSAARFAMDLANKEKSLVVFGIKPTRPDTGYGYVQVGKKLGENGSVQGYAVKRFVEKPDHKTAVAYCKAGTYLWNSGMFVWKTSVILEEFSRYMPDLFKLVYKAAAKGFSQSAINEFYGACEKESIDYGVMEKSTRVSAVAASFRWDDVGSWDAVPRVRGVNKAGTAVSGKGIFEADCTNSIIVNDSNLTVAAVGLDNIVLVTTKDAILAIPREKLPDIKKYLAAMKTNKSIPKNLF